MTQRRLFQDDVLQQWEASSNNGAVVIYRHKLATVLTEIYNGVLVTL